MTIVFNPPSTIVSGPNRETFSPVVKPATIRTVLFIALSKSWPAHQLDVTNAFLHGNIYETVYMHQPMGFRNKNFPDYVCLLVKALYGLKQASQAWYKRFTDFVLTLGFHHSKCDASLFILHQGRHTAYLLLYVDDILLVTSSDDLRLQLMAKLASEFAMKDLGPPQFLFGHLRSATERYNVSLSTLLCHGDYCLGMDAILQSSIHSS